MNSVGLHIRIIKSVQEAIDKAKRLELPLFQCFFISQDAGTHIPTSPRECKRIAQQISTFDRAIAHGSYWINPASVVRESHRVLEREVLTACRMGFTDFVLHPGSARGATDHAQGMDALIRTLNNLTKQSQDDITLMLENVAFGPPSIGGDLCDFTYILERVDKPELVQMCIDTAHAFSYGFDLCTPAGQQKLFESIEEAVGMHRVKLIHLNDAMTACGSHMDRHAIVGEGLIGNDALRTFITNSRCVDIPAILELPPLEESVEIAIVDRIRQWRT